jgi:hypothetical protein
MLTSVVLLQIHEAAEEGHLETVKRLIETKEYHVNCRNYVSVPRSTLLGVVNTPTNPAVHCAASKYERTPLMVATMHGQVAVVECLLGQGASTDATDHVKPLTLRSMRVFSTLFTAHQRLWCCCRTGRQR